MEKQKERDSHSNTNCGTWTKTVTLKVRRTLKPQWPRCCDARNRHCNQSGFSAHRRVFGSSLRLPGSLLSDDPIDRQLLTADPYTNLHRANEMRTAAQRALFKQNSARAVQAAGLARHSSQPRVDINAGDTTTVWRNNKLTGRKGWTGPGVVVAVSPTRTSIWISMRGCMLKCSSEQVRKATDAEWPGAELSKTLGTELLKRRQRSGQRGYVDVETEGQPTEEPPADARPDVSQILGAVVPAPRVLTPIPEEGELMDTTIREAAEAGPGTRPRQPETSAGTSMARKNHRKVGQKQFYNTSQSLRRLSSLLSKRSR